MQSRDGVYGEAMNPQIFFQLMVIVVAATCLVALALRLFDSWKEWKRTAPLPCSHEWDVRATIVARPIAMDITPGSHVDPYQMRSIERMNTGSTSVLLTCSRCGSCKEQTFNGLPVEP